MKFSEQLTIKATQFAIGAVLGAERLFGGLTPPLGSPAFARNPYVAYARLREQQPVYYSRSVRAWWVSSFALVQEMLRDDRFGSDVRAYEFRASKIRKVLNAKQLARFEQPSMLSLDPPHHTRIRKLAARGFVMKYIRSLEPRIEKIIQNCLAPVSNHNQFDVIEQLAKPLPAIVIAEMLGLPESDHNQFQTWSEDLIEATSTSDLGVIKRGREADQNLIDYFNAVVANKRITPGEDFISELILAEGEGGELTAMELYNTCLLLLVAGHETTTRLIGNGLYLLLKNPPFLQKLVQDQTLIPNAIEEMLRYEPPVQATQRFAKADLEFHGHRMKKGDIIFVSLAAANRDPVANSAPDVFNPFRDKVQQVAFGYGIHHCIGASLARLEAKLAFEALLTRYPNMALASDVKWGNNPFFRGLDQLVIRPEGLPLSSAITP